MNQWSDYDKPPAMRPGVGVDASLIGNRKQAPAEWTGPALDEGCQDWSGPSPLVGENVVRWRFLSDPHGGVNFMQCIDADGRVFVTSMHITTAGHTGRGRAQKTQGRMAQLRAWFRQRRQ